MAALKTEHDRPGDLAVIKHAIERTMPSLMDARSIGLKDVAALCRKRVAAHPGSDWPATRDEILTIASEWNLAHDDLEAQSDACLAFLSRFLRER